MPNCADTVVIKGSKIGGQGKAVAQAEGGGSRGKMQVLMSRLALRVI